MQDSSVSSGGSCGLLDAQRRENDEKGDHEDGWTSFQFVLPSATTLALCRQQLRHGLHLEVVRARDELPIVRAARVDGLHLAPMGVTHSPALVVVVDEAATERAHLRAHRAVQSPSLSAPKTGSSRHEFQETGK